MNNNKITKQPADPQMKKNKKKTSLSKIIFLLIINLALFLLIILTVYYLINQKENLFAGTFINKLDKTLDVNIKTQPPESIIAELKRQKPKEIPINAIYVTSYSASAQDNPL